MADLVRLPIANSSTGNCYTLKLGIGEPSVAVEVMLDTGSSMTAVNLGPYDPDADRTAKTSQLLQNGSFQDGTFIAAVVRTSVGVLTGAGAVGVSQAAANLGVVYDVRPFLFGNVDGILGLAYPALNAARRMPEDTWKTRYGPAQLGLGLPAGDLAPLLDQMASGGKIAHKFAFSVGRSISSKADAALNNGTLVLGGGEECRDLYTGAFTSVAVVHQAYYNTDLVAIEVGGRSVKVAPIAAGDPAVSNSIVDSGNSSLMLDAGLFQQVIGLFNAVDATFGNALQAGSCDQTKLTLADWPALNLVLQGVGGADVTLTVEPRDYWQLDGYGVGTATAGLTSGRAPYAGQSILGLPLFAGHYVVFDRTGSSGAVKFAARAGESAAGLVA